MATWAARMNQRWREHRDPELRELMNEVRANRAAAEKEQIRAFCGLHRHLEEKATPAEEPPRHHGGYA